MLYKKFEIKIKLFDNIYLQYNYNYKQVDIIPLNVQMGYYNKLIIILWIS